MKKVIQKSIRLSDRVFTYIEGYRGDNFNQRLENYILDTEERRDLLVHDWNMLQAAVYDKHEELKRIQVQLREMRQEVR